MHKVIGFRSPYLEPQNSGAPKRSHENHSKDHWQADQNMYMSSFTHPNFRSADWVESLTEKGAPRFEPRIPGWEAYTLPLSCAKT